MALAGTACGLVLRAQERELQGPLRERPLAWSAGPPLPNWQMFPLPTWFLGPVQSLDQAPEIPLPLQLVPMSLHKILLHLEIGYLRMTAQQSFHKPQFHIALAESAGG